MYTMIPSIGLHCQPGRITSLRCSADLKSGDHTYLKIASPLQNGTPASDSTNEDLNAETQINLPDLKKNSNL